MTKANQISLEEVSRGVVAIETEEELARKWQRSRESGKPLRVKLGIDPTDPQLHLGHTVQLRKMRQFQDAGHLGVLIIGDYTAVVGDPSGRDKTRPPIAHDQVRKNAEPYLQQAWKVLDREKTELHYNGEWFSKMSFLDVMELCSSTTVARQLERDDFEKRYSGGLPISVHEFIYPLMQARDSVEVESDIEVGGTDQLFNLLLGRDLMRQAGMEPQVCMTLPLLVGTDGVQKMSKSYGNSIGINDDANEIFGKVMSISDDVMRDYFVLATDFSNAEIEEILSDGPREAKATLARRIVELYHGESAGAAAVEHFDRVFRDREQPEEMPEVRISADDLENGEMWVVKLVVDSGLASGNNDARRKVEGGGVRVDGELVEDPKAQVAVSDGAVLRVGKKNFRRLKVL
ncbi:MAG TPA: tyrosine--tRNA ligase [Planctomycetes bacterium]|nr:tyrosine--tRNA ligase [Planctomycetota bacterium]HIN80186.1 tyrosine--tRNA ligase [Planctomycetota bacterium]